MVELKLAVQHMETTRGFDSYVKELRRFRINLPDIIIDKALLQDHVNFYDLGCGHGMASLDFFPVLERRAKERRIPRKHLDNIYYIGVDKYIRQQPAIDDERISFHTPVDLNTIGRRHLPPVDIGLSFFVFPYLEHKLEALAEMYGILRQEDEYFYPGMLLVTEYNDDQIKMVPRRTRLANQYIAGLDNVDLRQTVQGDRGVVRIKQNLIRLVRGDAKIIPFPYLCHIDEAIEWGRCDHPRGKRAFQKISVYSRAA